MGQGSYTGILYGVVIDEATQDKYYALDEEDKLPEAGKDKFLSVHTSYECEPYLGIWVSISDGALANWREVKFSLEGKAVPISQLATLAEKSDNFAAIKHAFNDYRTACAKVGLQLPEPELLLVSDYD